MAPEDLLMRIRARPFEPFRAITTDGTIYEVRHPELVMLTLGSAYFGYPAPGREGVAQRVDMVSMRHIIRLEDLEHQAAAQGNGSESSK